MSDQKTTAQDSPTSLAESFWNRHRADIGRGAFWADQIKELKGEPRERLALAIDNLPLPGAFSEAAVAVRSIIREKRKRKDDYQEELALLYWLAAIASFSVPYSTLLSEPGFNILVTIPKDIVKELPFTYTELGYRHLSLLNKTDAKWLVAAWGEPTMHTTLYALHQDTWVFYEQALYRDRKSREGGLLETLPSSPLKSTDDDLFNGKTLLIAVVAVIAIFFWIAN